MPSFSKIIKVVDAVCSCLPIVSTIKNSIQIIYDLVHKVDTVANPIKPSWKTDLKIHTLNSSSLRKFVGAIPILGNIINLIEIMVDGLPKELSRAVVDKNEEVVKLYLARHPLEDDEKAKKILDKAAYSSNFEVFNLILESREWNSETLLNALKICSWHPGETQEKIVKKILEYYKAKKYPLPLLDKSKSFEICQMTKPFLEAKKLDAAKSILELLPSTDYWEVSDVLKLSLENFNEYKKLNQDRLADDIVNLALNACSDCQTLDLFTFCEMAHQATKNIKTKTSTSSSEETTLNKRILDEFYKNRNEVFESLINKVKKPKPSDIRQVLAKLISLGEMDFIKSFLKYQDANFFKIKAFEEIIYTTLNKVTDDQVKVFEFVFNKYQIEFNDDECIKLLEKFANPYSEAIMNCILKSRPSLETEQQSEIEEIKNRYKKRVEKKKIEQSFLL